MEDITLEDVVEEGVLYSFYGVDSNYFKIGNLIFEAIEDEADGYRSHLSSILLTKPTNAIFPVQPIINLFYTVDSLDYHDFISFVDRKGHEWLKIGTDNTDDYYPYFVFNYNPRKDVRKYSIPIHNLDKYDPQSIHPEKLI